MTSNASRSLPRTNGWDCPWHPFQVLVWFFIMLFVVCHYGFLVFYFPSYWRIVGYIIPALVIFPAVICIIVTTTLDPADSNLKSKMKRGIFRRGFFDRAKHGHVIEDLHCHLCDTDVGYRSKHCRICDKCIDGFDHHCKWLNTCVGSKNYWWFIVSITSSLIGAVLISLLSGIFFILYFIDRDHIRHYCDITRNISSCDSTIKIFGASAPDPLFPSTTAVIGVLGIIATGLLGHLTIFHFYLICKGLSTYDYIMLQRETDGSKSLTKDEDKFLCFKQKANRVTPVGEVEQQGGETCSMESAGMATFNRTPPPLDIESDPNANELAVLSHEDLDSNSTSAKNGERTSDNDQPYCDTKEDVPVEVHSQEGNSRTDEEDSQRMENNSIMHKTTVQLFNDVPMETHDSLEDLNNNFLLDDVHEARKEVEEDKENSVADISLEQSNQYVACPEKQSLQEFSVKELHSDPQPTELVILPIECPSPEPLEAQIKKVTFGGSESCSEINPTLLHKNRQASLPPISTDRPMPQVPIRSETFGKRPLPPLRREELVGSFESLTSVQSSHSSTSLSSADPRYQRRSLNKSPIPVELEKESSKLTKSKRKRVLSVELDHLSQSQPLAPLLEHR